MAMLNNQRVPTLTSPVYSIMVRIRSKIPWMSNMGSLWFIHPYCCIQEVASIELNPFSAESAVQNLGISEILARNGGDHFPTWVKFTKWRFDVKVINDHIWWISNCHLWWPVSQFFCVPKIASPQLDLQQTCNSGEIPVLALCENRMPSILMVYHQFSIVFLFK